MINEAFTLGEVQGDHNNLATGSLTGTLIAGRNDQFFYDAYINVNLPYPVPSGATATGSFSLTFTPIPEPAQRHGSRRPLAQSHFALDRLAEQVMGLYRDA